MLSASSIRCEQGCPGRNQLFWCVCHFEVVLVVSSILLQRLSQSKVTLNQSCCGAPLGRNGSAISLWANVH